ncbi:hypothetical protein MUP77_06240 [Candidatus Bathyarchaeota archaeon]|nr:hypothetical protein [Candidatus Bathyarchaeota archaeon]
MGLTGDDAERKEAVKVLQKQVTVESELVRLYEDTVGQVQSSAVRHILHMMALDSMKHIDLCQTVMEVLEGADILQPEKGELIQGLHRHLALEKESIDVGNTLLKNGWIRETRGLKELVKKFRDEEKEHHRTLTKLAESAYFRKDETGDAVLAMFRDEDWFERRYVEAKRLRKKFDISP